MKIYRRELLEMGSQGMLALAIPAMLSGCSGIKRQDLATLTAQDDKQLSINKDEYEILTLASLAPSGHNMQPWFVKRSKAYEYLIGVDKVRLLPAVDPQNRETMLSLGAFIQNLSLAATAFGYDSRIEVIGKSSHDEEIAKVSLKKAPVDAFDVEKIRERRTLKKGQKKDLLKPEDVGKLAAAWPGHVFYFPAGSKHAGCLAEWTTEAFRHQTWRNDAQQALANCVRFSRSDIIANRYGLTTDNMEMPPALGWLVRTFMKPQDVMGRTFRSQGIDLYAEMAKQGGGWIIITGQGGSVADLIEAGRRFESLALMAREMRIAIHPMTQILEEKTWRDQFLGKHGPDVIPQFCLRVGYVDTFPAPVSIRRPVEWFLRVCRES